MSNQHASAEPVTVRPKPTERAAPKSILDGGKLPESIDVGHIIFHEMQKIPGNHNAQSWRAADRDSRGTYKFTYITRMNMLEGIYTPSDVKLQPEAFLVPMTNVEYLQAK